MSKPQASPRIAAWTNEALTASIAARSISARHLAVGKIGKRRRPKMTSHAALFQRTIHAVPHQFGGALAAGMAELQGNLRRGIGVDEIDDAPPRGLLLVVPQAGAARA